MRQTLVDYLQNYDMRNHEEWKRIESAFNQVIETHQGILHKWSDHARDVMRFCEDAIVATFIQREEEN